MPPDKTKSPRDSGTLSVTVFRIFKVDATGPGIEHVPKMMPWLLVAAIFLTVVMGGGITLIMTWLR